MNKTILKSSKLDLVILIAVTLAAVLWAFYKIGYSPESTTGLFVVFLLIVWLFSAGYSTFILSDEAIVIIRPFRVISRTIQLELSEINRVEMAGKGGPAFNFLGTRRGTINIALVAFTKKDLRRFSDFLKAHGIPTVNF
ncbi:hypothetical protein [Hymenobacter daeguensis]